MPSHALSDPQAVKKVVEGIVYTVDTVEVVLGGGGRHLKFQDGEQLQVSALYQYNCMQMLRPPSCAAAAIQNGKKDMVQQLETKGLKDREL